MQNHLEISLENQFWTRSVRNWTKTLTSVMSGPTRDSINVRNTQGEIYETDLGNIYGIYKECITNISIDIYSIKYKIITHTHTGAAFGGRPIGSVFLIILINIYGYSSYMDDI